MLLLKCLEVEEQHKSKTYWVQLGDSNTSYFHTTLKKRRENNTIRCIKTANGSHIISRDEIASETIDFYENMFSE